VTENVIVCVLFVLTSCLNQCTYCKTKHARGELGSYSPVDIIHRAQQSFQGFCCWFISAVGWKCFLLLLCHTVVLSGPVFPVWAYVSLCLCHCKSLVY